MRHDTRSLARIGLTLCALIAFAAKADVVLFADYSDPDAIRVGDDYYLVSSSFQNVPGLPILHSRDLVDWTIVGHAVDRLPSPDTTSSGVASTATRPQHGNGMWAPSLRHHDGWFWIYVGDPDRGIYMTRARDARGPWEPLTLVKEAKGWIDPCPLWDDDGSMYLVHAWAKSRAGFNSVLHVNRLSPDGRRVIDDGAMVFDGRERHPTIEGPKFYKRNGWYYIFAPAGGVKRGWQTVLRSKSVYGPYEDKVVLEGGFHQGAWVDDWFVHFQDRGAYGRIVHRQPLRWVNDWPEICRTRLQPASPGEGRAEATPYVRRSSDEFDSHAFGLQWQWHGNPQKHWYSLRNGKLRLSPAEKNLWNATNLLLQKFSAPAFHATTRVDASALKEGERAGLVVMGADYSALTLERTKQGLVLRRVTARDADQGGAETELGVVPIGKGAVELRVTVAPEAVARFSYSTGGDFRSLGTAFVARPGRWIGAKVGLFGRADFDWFRVEPFEPAESASLIVAKDGSGDFRTIQEAIDAIPSSNEDNQTILIRNGTYREKVMIAKSYVALVGEDREKTRIEFAELRRNWRASHPDDWGAAVINIADGATDIIIANLTVLNDYGRRHGDHDHQFAIRAMDRSNRIAVLHANVIADGGDFDWFADNLHTAEGSPRDEDVTAEWTFGGRWDPASLPAVLPHAAIPRPEDGWQWADPAGVTLRWTPGRNARAQRICFSGTPASSPAGPQASRVCAPGAGGEDAAGPAVETTAFHTGPLEPGKTYSWRVDDGPLWSFRADPRPTRIALVGDSTVTEKSGWGRGLASHVEESAAVMNLARGGRSSKSYRNEGHWDDVLRRKPTHILLQFGHNDEPGKGLERETDLPAFRANMARYVDDARAIGAKPILVTSHFGHYAAATREVASEKNVPLIDLHAKSSELLKDLGSAITFDALVADELRRVAPDLATHLRKPTANRQPPTANWSARMADSVMKRTPDPLWLDAREAPRWEYTPGLVLKSVLDVWQRTGDDRYWKYAHAYYDAFVNADGTIRAYNKDEYNIDRINPGKPLFLLYEKTKEEKYRKAIELLRQQMREHPRTKEGGFWHKKRYPYQMWLDGLYMGAPFLAQYAKTFNEPALFDDIVNQFVWMESHARDEKTGLLYHGWDESRQQKWADPKTGRSPAFWGRAMGWYAMGLVETLDFVPLEHPRRRELIAILQRLAEAVTKVQDPKSGVWWQVVDQGGREGNYLEASVSVMFSFALLKASRLGYIDKSYSAAGRRAYEGVLKEFIEVDKDGLVNIHRVCEVAGLGGDPEKGERYRAGTYEYYVSEKIRSNDPKAVGPFIFASLEMERR